MCFRHRRGHKGCMWMYCVQTDTKIISAPVETRLAFTLNSKNFKSIQRLLFQSLCISGVCSHTRTLICDCLQPTNNPQILQSRRFLFLPPASLGLISPLLKRTEAKLQRTYSHEEHITPSDSLCLAPSVLLTSSLGTAVPTDTTHSDSSCGVGSSQRVSPLPSLAKMIHFPITAMRLWNQLCNQWWVVSGGTSGQMYLFWTTLQRL